jgi:molecular chaperone GrpE (heat shock protein)
MVEKHCRKGSHESQDSTEERPDALNPEALAVEKAELEEKLKAAETMADALKQEGLRIKADFMNYRARVERDSARMKVLAAESAVINLIPVLDNLDRAILSAEKPEGAALLEGVRMVRAQFFSALQTLGLEEISALGESFNPEVHEAILVSPVQGPEEDGKVLGVLEKGYRLGDRIVRPSKVQVGRYES